MKKAILGLILVAGVGWTVMHYARELSSFDPSQQGLQHRARITPGMTWKEVLEVNPPKKWRAMKREVTKVGKEKIEVVNPGPLNPYDADRLALRLMNDGVPDGFRFEYVYSLAVAFEVDFDGKGMVREVIDLTTLGDVFQYEKPALKN